MIPRHHTNFIAQTKYVNMYQVNLAKVNKATEISDILDQIL